MAELKEEFQDLFCLRVMKRTVHLDIYTKLNPLVCFHRIYQGSIFLRLLCYFLREEKESFACFIQKEYLSRATGYRLRDKCLDFLKGIRLSLDKYQVIGPEYRIRFLIALLEYKFGIHLYAITEKELEIIFNLISASNAHLSREAFEEAYRRKSLLLHFNCFNVKTKGFCTRYSGISWADSAQNALCLSQTVVLDQEHHGICVRNNIYSSRLWLSLSSLLYGLPILFSKTNGPMKTSV